MRLDIVNKSFEFENGLSPSDKPIYKSLNLQAQVNKPPFDGARFEFLIDGIELKEFLESGKSYDDLARDKIREILELDIEKVDAFDIESYRRELAEKDKEIERLDEELAKNSESASIMFTELAIALSNVNGGK